VETVNRLSTFHQNNVSEGFAKLALKLDGEKSNRSKSPSCMQRYSSPIINTFLSVKSKACHSLF